MYSQQFTLCYFLVKSPLLIRFKNFLRHRSVSGAPPPKKNPGSAPGKTLHNIKYCEHTYVECKHTMQGNNAMNKESVRKGSLK